MVGLDPAAESVPVEGAVRERTKSDRPRFRLGEAMIVGRGGREEGNGREDWEKATGKGFPRDEVLEQRFFERMANIGPSWRTEKWEMWPLVSKEEKENKNIRRCKLNDDDNRKKVMKKLPNEPDRWMEKRKERQE